MSKYSLLYRVSQRLNSICWLLNKEFFNIRDIFIKNIVAPPKVETIENTLNHIITSKCSVARFGDGEMKIVRGENISFQTIDVRLQEKLKIILRERTANLIVCLPDVFSDLSIYRDFDKNYWKKHLAETRLQWYKNLNKEYVYFDAFISRFYMPYADKSNTAKYIGLWKQVWQDRDVLIVEGEKTRLGVGNDLFDCAKSIKRILGPNKNVFEYYNDIIEHVRKYDKNHLILIALGPTATAMAYDLHCLGYQAIDIGHIDIEYEWYLMGATEKIKVPNKITNEAINGYIVGDSSNIDYQRQIIFHIKPSSR